MQHCSRRSDYPLLRTFVFVLSSAFSLRHQNLIYPLFLERTKICFSISKEKRILALNLYYGSKRSEHCQSRAIGKIVRSKKSISFRNIIYPLSLSILLLVSQQLFCSLYFFSFSFYRLKQLKLSSTYFHPINEVKMK
jgi:hypothetical protein